MTDQIFKPSNRRIVYDVAMSMLGTPYKWGGKNLLDGLDCSQFVIEIAKAAGLPPPTDMTAQQLHDYYERHGTASFPMLGVLAFYGPTDRNIRHVGFCLNADMMIEAGGGGEIVTNATEATKAGAMVRVRPIKARLDLVDTLLPDWPDWTHSD